MILSRIRRLDVRLVVGVSFLSMLVVTTPGCGSSPPSSNTAVAGEGKGAAVLLKPEQLWKVKGTGRDRRKVPISRRERRKLLHEAQKTAG